ncbi:hypothetical protein [Streptomyces sp. NPDC002343]
MALDAALQGRVHSVLVPDTEIIRARQMLCDHRGLAAEHGAATAPAALTPTSTTATPARLTAAPTCPPAATAPATLRRSASSCAEPTPTPPT